MGEDAEPDSLYFVESWTLGKPEALLHLKQRLQVQSECERRSRVFDAIDRFGATNFATEYASSVVPTSSASVSTSAEANNSGRLRDFIEEPAIQTQWRAAQDSRHVQDELCDSTQEAYIPMTHELAYQLLGVTQRSTRMEIKAAYRHKVGQWHPDRLEQDSAKMRHLATQKMAGFNAAYRLLRSAGE